MAKNAVTVADTAPNKRNHAAFNIPLLLITGVRRPPVSRSHASTHGLRLRGGGGRWRRAGEGRGPRSRVTFLPRRWTAHTAARATLTAPPTPPLPSRQAPGSRRRARCVAAACREGRGGPRAS